VVFDIGHGCGSFSWDTARRAFEHNFYPDTISTDLHRYCVQEPLFVSLPEVMSKMLCLGMSLEDVILKTTAVPAQVLGIPEIGTLRPGAVADVFVFDLQLGEFEFLDAQLKALKGSKRIIPYLVVRNGELFHSGSFSIRFRELYESDRDVLNRIGITS
jgi:dihydroorotase